MVVEDGREGGPLRRLNGGELGQHGAGEVTALVPLLEHLDRQVAELALHLLTSLHQFQECYGSRQVTAQLQHLLVRRLVILPVLTSLHLLGAAAERYVRVVRRHSGSMLCLHRQNQRLLL